MIVYEEAADSRAAPPARLLQVPRSPDALSLTSAHHEPTGFVRFRARWTGAPPVAQLGAQQHRLPLRLAEPLEAAQLLKMHLRWCRSRFPVPRAQQSGSPASGVPQQSAARRTAAWAAPAPCRAPVSVSSQRSAALPEAPPLTVLSRYPPSHSTSGRRTRHWGPSAERSTEDSSVGCPRALQSPWKRRSFSSDAASFLSS